MSFFFHQTPAANTSHSQSDDETSQEHPLAEIVRFSIIAILIVIPIRTFIAQPFIVSGASMENTFHTGEYIVVDQVTYYFEKPTRGDVIIFRYPRDPSKYFIKRVIGLPGDTINIKQSVVTISNDQQPDGFELDEAYIKSMRPAPDLTETLGEREYFVMGDNRDQSSDSRAWGVLQESGIIGRALVRLFPFDVINYLPGKTEPTVTHLNN